MGFHSKHKSTVLVHPIRRGGVAIKPAFLTYYSFSWVAMLVNIACSWEDREQHLELESDQIKNSVTLKLP